jgi:hypothetical protein
MSRYRTRDVVKVRRPSTTRFEFVGGFIEGSVTGGAGVDAGSRHVLVVFAGERSFSSFFTEDAELLFAMLACYFDIKVARWQGGLPFDRTACHSSSDFWSGYDILFELLVLKKLDRKGIVGIDFKMVPLVKGWRAL